MCDDKNRPKPMTASEVLELRKKYAEENKGVKLPFSELLEDLAKKTLRILKESGFK